jgi:putative adenylate-forming enzyme
MSRPLAVLWAYHQAKQRRFHSRAALEQYQASKLEAFGRKLTAKSPYFSRFAGMPIREWPEMNKATMLAHFDEINTASLKLQDVFATAMAAEESRDFKPALGQINVGLSSGTLGQRGVFAISDQEASRWAGILLAKVLPDGLFIGERVALFLRANSNVYEAVNSRWLTFRYFDLFASFEQNVSALRDYGASIIVAPAQVLRELSLRVLSGELRLSPKRVISVAEVLEPMDRALIEQAFPRVDEIYQATEGFLACTCPHGTLHLNEEYVHVEPKWLDVERRRFTPLITDFTRYTQPFVRYALDDVLVARREPCPCGSVTRALEAIEGRCDDMLLLPGRKRQVVTVFADVLSRVFARYLPEHADYRLIQTAEATLQLHGSVDESSLQRVRDRLSTVLEQLDVEVTALTWQLGVGVPPMDTRAKRRRIVRHG